MTREETKKCIEVMKHFEDGGEVQILVYDYGGRQEWEDFPNPDWNWDYHTYRIKPQSMKVTEEERILLQIKGRIIKAKNSNYITIVNDGDVELLRNEFYFLNKETQEWEDWSEDADALKHFYNGGQP